MSDSPASRLNATANPNVAPVPSEPLLDLKVFPNASAVYFWNSSLPQEGNMVCYTTGATWDDLVKPCCPPELGIYDDGAKACRLQNSDAVANFFTNCTQELVWDYIGNWGAKDWNATTAKTPEDVLGLHTLEPTCDTFVSYRDRQLKERSSSLESAMVDSQFKDVRGSMVCSGIGESGHFNMTGQCCGESGGIVKW